MLSEMAEEQNRRGLKHYVGISLLNVAEADRFEVILRGCSTQRSAPSRLSLGRRPA